MNPTPQRCGFDLHYCDDCARPESLRAWCQQHHRMMLEARTIVRSQSSPDAYSALIDLLATQAVDLALEATKRPLAAIDILRAIVTNRVNELYESGVIKAIGEDSPARESKTIH